MNGNKLLEDANLRLVRKLVSNVVQILQIVSFSVVYKYNSLSTEWERIGAEGPFFLLERQPDNKDPENYALLVANRTSDWNCVHLIGRDFEFDQNDSTTFDASGKRSLLAVRSGDGDIYGFWFTEASECALVMRNMDAILRFYNGTQVRRLKKESKDALLHKPNHKKIDGVSPACLWESPDYPEAKNGIERVEPKSFVGEDSEKNFVMSKEQMKDVLLTLAKDDGFIETLHSMYMMSLNKK